MIPKTIHYCWFGKGEIPQLEKDCIVSWHKYMPDWQYKLWNEQNFDVNCIPYVSEAYKAGKYAFVSDYVRLYALNAEGGLYLDTDVEVFKPFDDLMHLTAFIGYEGSKHHPPGTGVIASEAGGEWVREQIAEYDGVHFVKPDGSFDLTPNPERIASSMMKNGAVFNQKYQTYKDLHIFPVDYFCPRQTTMEYLRTENTYCDHHFAASWVDDKKEPLLLRIIGQKNMTRLIKLKRKILG